MDDRRVSDLSYGHLGEATYDLDEKSWSFSREPGQGRSIQLLQPLLDCIPPSLLAPPSSTLKPSRIRYAQEKLLTKNVPEVAPASALLSFIGPLETPAPVQTATLMAVGMAASLDSAHSTTIQIFAVAHGEAGHVLRLIRPRAEDLGWDGHKGIKLRVLNPAASEETFWLGDGGAIQQIAFGTNKGGATSWLAVRKADSTTILRPIHRRFPTTSDVSKGLGIRYPPSCLSPNPILTLQSERTGARPHADVSFNPWYIRQFAILDEQGNWSIWGIEGLQRKREKAEASPGKSGHIYDLLSDESLQKLNDADGWGRILWAASLSTIIICQRRHMAIFDLKARPRRLYSPALVETKSTDWIIEVKRSPLRLDQIFALTTSQIFWLQITAADEFNRDDGHAGARILLSCHHFRDEEDETMKLEIVNEDDACVVFLYSLQNRLVKVYRFGLVAEGSTAPNCSEDSFVIPTAAEDQKKSPIEATQTLCIIPAIFKPSFLSEMSGPGRAYVERGVRFYQLFGLDANLALSYSLCATNSLVARLSGGQTKHLAVQAPTTKTSKNSKLSSAVVVEDQFVVPDGLDENQCIIEGVNMPLTPAVGKSPRDLQSRSRNQLSMTFDAHRLFKMAFFEGEDKQSLSPSLAVRSSTIAECMEQVWRAVMEKREKRLQVTSTILELSGYSSLSEDVDEAASSLRALIDSLSQEKEGDPSMVVNLLSLTLPPIVAGETDINANENPPSLSDVYDRMIESWVSSLPHQTPGQMRLAKERTVRAIAAELCLASVAVAIRDKTVHFPESTKPSEKFDLTLPVRPRADFYSSQESRARQTPDSQDMREVEEALYSAAPVLPTPNSTPRHTREEHIPSEAPAEDPAIARLRSYTLSIKSQPPLSTAASLILDHWPTTPGLDPANYSWESARKAISEVRDQDTGDEDTISRRKEEERRRHRTERFLKRQRDNSRSVVSQPVPIVSFGSQPDPAANVTSSQPTEDALLMSQPDRGLFGTRIGQKSWKKRRTKGF